MNIRDSKNREIRLVKEEKKKVITRIEYPHVEVKAMSVILSN